MIRELIQVVIATISQPRCNHSAQSWESLDGQMYCDDCNGFIQQFEDGYWYRVHKDVNKNPPANSR